MNYFHAFGRNHQNFEVFSAPLPGNLLFRRCGHELYRYLVTPPFLLPPLRAGLPMSRWVSATTHPYGQNADARSQQSPPLPGRGNRAQLCCHGVFFEDGHPLIFSTRSFVAEPSNSPTSFRVLCSPHCRTCQILHSLKAPMNLKTHPYKIIPV